MAVSEHEVRIATGRRADDGRVRISIFADRLLALSIEGQGERVPTLLLTLEQAKKLKDALSELIPLAEDAVPEENMIDAGAWHGTDRRLANR